jgi:hypothetical protein
LLKFIASSALIRYHATYAGTGWLAVVSQLIYLHLLKNQSTCIHSASLKMLTFQSRFDVKIHTPQVVETKAFPTNGGV